MLLIFGFLLNIISIGSIVINPMVSLDSGYYLAIANEVYEGKVYFKEIGIPYNPLAIFAFGFPFLFDDFPNYRWHIIINMLIIISSSLLFYRIANKISIHKDKNILFTLLFLFLTLTFDGKYLMLEPLSVFFQLLALYVYLSHRESGGNGKLFFVGLAISLSFLAKQYGLFILLPIAIDILFYNESKIKSMIIVGIGVGVPLSLFYSYLGINGYGILDFLKAILGKGVEMDVGNGTAINASLTSHLVELLYFVLFNLYILIIPILYFKLYNKLDSKKLLFFIAFISSLTVLYFATYFHYFQYVIPYALLLFIYLFYKISSSKYIKSSFLLLGLSTTLLCAYTFLNLQKGNTVAIEKQRQEKVTLNKWIPEKSHVYLDGPSPALYYLCDFRSIDLEGVSYSFPGYFYPKTIISKLQPGYFLVVSDSKKEEYKKYAIDCDFQEIILGEEKYTIIKKNRIIIK